MSLVFMTSRGVVTAAAMPPDTEPHTADSYECVGRSVTLAIELFIFSYKGNCTSEKGISLMRVMPKPLYKPAKPSEAMMPDTTEEIEEIGEIRKTG